MDALLKVMTAIQNNRILQGISKGFVMAMPVIFMGSFTLVILCPTLLKALYPA